MVNELPVFTLKKRPGKLVEEPAQVKPAALCPVAQAL